MLMKISRLVYDDLLLVGSYRYFGGAGCLHVGLIDPEDGGNKIFRNVGIYLPTNKALCTRRLKSSTLSI
jgi:hypothetical protein